jgi:hypothetical protein
LLERYIRGPWACRLNWVDLNRIVLNPARSREFPGGSSRHGYDFIAPLDSQGRIDPLLWKKYRHYCRVRRFWAGEEDEVGRLVHKPGGAEHARWMFDYNPDEDDDDEAGYKFGAHAFLPGEYVSISGHDGRLQTFRVVTVDPVVLSMALFKSFELEIILDRRQRQRALRKQGIAHWLEARSL